MTHPRLSLSLCALPLDVLDNVAFRVAVLELLGPSRHLAALRSTCTYLNDVFSVERNPHLYARIFCAKFDYRAARRRFFDNATYAHALAHQCELYSRALRNIHCGDINSPTVESDLWSAFDLCSENDGRNIEQLEWAGVFDYTQRFINEKLWADREQFGGWPAETVANSLALWLYWYTSTEDRFASIPADERNRLLYRLHPYAAYNFRYPAFLAPDNHFHLPLYGDPDAYRERSIMTPHGYYPLYRNPQFCKHKLRHYGQSLTLAEPPIGLVAKVLYVALQEQEPVDNNMQLYATRALADASNWVGPTHEDMREYARTRAVRFPLRGDWDWRSQLSDADGALADAPVWRQDGAVASASAMLDNDWERWRGCYDPWATDVRSGPKYAFGSLSGSWGGRLLDPGNVSEYIHGIHSATFDEELEFPTRQMPARPLFFTLREHHCVSPATPIPHPILPNDPLDEGVMNGFLPPEFPDRSVIVEQEGRVRITVPRGSTNMVCTYETYAKGKANSHDPDTCEMCAAGRQEEEAERIAPLAELLSDEDAGDTERARSVVQAALGDAMDVDDLIDSVAHNGDGDGDNASVLSAETTDSAGSHATTSSGATEMFRSCSGILDILLTGTTHPRHARAYGNFIYYGRVRSWDGLVVLVRVPGPHLAPLSPRPETLDTYVLRGHLLGGVNFVGAWRAANGGDTVHVLPIEGTFAVSKVDSAAAASTEPGPAPAAPV
ncbi:hypothetical protein BD413DRAFT_617880 [Trametes elegans]|nr:hypothetical protein BD413DRAFT_617880 [Trametes elegans]